VQEKPPRIGITELSVWGKRVVFWSRFVSFCLLQLLDWATWARLQVS
jgi:hypothetical protein